MVKIGLEIHGYLTTNEKLFCNCKNAHKEADVPNTYICPICTGQPGSKPMLPNAKAIKKIIQIALILNCKINTLPKQLVWWRKHYSWPDLPKGYQNTVSGSYALHPGEKGKFLDIGITECHLEEDPAAWNPEKGTINYNRSGAPLVEIVTDPDFKSAEQVQLWLKQLILTLSYIKALDANAGIKADVNVSIPNGKRIEVKNVNSISEIVKVIEHEIKRQKKDLPKEQETRQWDGEKTIKMRSKENQADYRFIKDPDLPVIELTKQEVEKIKKQHPESPMKKLAKIIKKHKISGYDAEVLTKNLEIVELFEQVAKKASVKLAVSWVTVELLGMLNFNKLTMNDITIKPEHLIQLLDLIEKKKITELNAKDILRSWKTGSKEVKANKVGKIQDAGELKSIIEKVIKDNSKAVDDFKAGNPQTLNFLIGQVMKLSNKRADFKTAKELLEKTLK